MSVCVMLYEDGECDCVALRVVPASVTSRRPQARSFVSEKLRRRGETEGGLKGDAGGEAEALPLGDEKERVERK